MKKQFPSSDATPKTNNGQRVSRVICRGDSFMKEIPLTQGQIAIIDDEMFDRVSYFKWHAYKHGNTYYAKTAIRLSNGKQTIIKMHQLVLGFPNSRIDHKNGNGCDNRVSNIREATNRQNGMNRKKSKGTSSQYKGVYLNRRVNKWQAAIVVNGDNIYLGMFTNEVDAAIAYDNAAIYYFKEFANLNFPLKLKLTQ